MKPNKKNKITTLDTLKAIKKANRENVVMPKSTVSKDKKKEQNKKECRDFKKKKDK